MKKFLSIAALLLGLSCCSVNAQPGAGQTMIPVGGQVSVGGGSTITPSYAGAGNISNGLCFSSPSPITAVTNCFGYGTNGSEAGQLELVNNSASNNAFAITNQSATGFAAITFRGRDPLFYTDATTIFEHMAVGWSPGQGYAYIESSSFDFTGNALLPPAELRVQQTGGVDASGGTTVTCTPVSGNTTMSCSANGGANGTLVTGTGIPPAATVSSGGGTTTIVLSAAPISSPGAESVLFTSPTYGQYTVASFTRQGPVYFYGWNGVPAFTVNRAARTVGIGAIASQGVPAATLEVGGTAQFDGGTLSQTYIALGYDYQTPTTGSTYTIPNNRSIATLEPAGTLATLTVKMPAAPVNGQIAGFCTTQTITSLTVSPNTSQVIRANTTPTTLAPGGCVKMIFNTNTVWYPSP